MSCLVIWKPLSPSSKSAWQAMTGESFTGLVQQTFYQAMQSGALASGDIMTTLGSVAPACLWNLTEGTKFKSKFTKCAENASNFWLFEKRILTWQQIISPYLLGYSSLSSFLSQAFKNVDWIETIQSIIKQMQTEAVEISIINTRWYFIISLWKS